MRPLVWFLVITVLLSASSMATAENSTEDEELRDQLQERLAEVDRTLDDQEVLETEEDEEAAAGGLLQGAGGFFSSLGSSIGSFVQSGVAQVSSVASVATAAGAAAVSVAFLATTDALLWSVTGVYSVITGGVVGVFDGAVALVAGAWALLGSLAAVAAMGRPAGMSQLAWTGTVAAGAATASVGAQVGLWSLLRRFGWIGAGLPLFSRIAKDDLLDHPLRSEIYEAIKSSPGIHISELARTVDAGWGTTIHHLRKLKDEDMVAVRMVNNQKCYFVNGGGVGRDTWGAISHLKNGTARRIAEFVHAHPLIAVTELSHKLGISASLVSHHVAKLTQGGVLEKVRDGRFIRLAVTQKAASSMFAETPVAPAAQAPVAA